MNPAAILALISDLYAQVTALQQENAALTARLSQPSVSEEAPGSPAARPGQEAV